MSPELIKEMKERREWLLANTHLTYRAAADHLDMAAPVLRRWCRKEDIEMHNPFKNSLWRQNPLDEDRIYMINQFTGKKDAVTLGEYLGCSVERVREFVVKHGLKTEIKSKYQKKTKIDRIVEESNPVMAKLLSTKRFGIGL